MSTDCAVSSNKTTVRDLLTGREKFDEENLPTPTSKQQIEVESLVEQAYLEKDIRGDLLINPDFPELRKAQTAKYLLKELFHRKISYEVYDCNRAWLCYWTVHSLSLIDYNLSDSEKSHIVNFLSTLQNECGGYGGGPDQYSHLAPTYASVNTLCIIGTEEAYKSINRKTLIRFLNNLRVGDGSFRMHVGGEIDIRSAYCAITVAKMTNTYSEELFKGTAEWIVRCQTYEGGFSGNPGMEAHGGYTFCGIAALHLLNSHHMCDMKSLLRWLVNRQMSYEGGFQGRTNKLVDSCYSFWQAGGIAIINMIMMANEEERTFLDQNSWLFNCNLLQEYVLLCCQEMSGGLIDKPGRRKDSYHTCYALSGLSLSQNLPNGMLHSIGSDENILEAVHPAYNITVRKLMDAREYFYSLSE